jgi:UDP-3-O-acyl-N-acetylglucosamine deacetylase
MKLEPLAQLTVGRNPSLSIHIGSEAHLAFHPMGTGGMFTRGQSSREVKLTSHPRSVLRLRMCNAIPTVPHTSSWRDA